MNDLIKRLRKAAKFGGYYAEAADHITELEGKLVTANEEIVCLTTAMPESQRLINQKRTINRLWKQLKAINNVGIEPHPSWNTSKEFNSGWKACKELIKEVQNE